MDAEDGKFHPKQGLLYVWDGTVDAADGSLDQKQRALAVFVGMLDGADETAQQKQGMMDARQPVVNESKPHDSRGMRFALSPPHPTG